jgi:hypothetical protein
LLLGCLCDSLDTKENLPKVQRSKPIKLPISPISLVLVLGANQSPDSFGGNKAPSQPIDHGWNHSGCTIWVPALVNFIEMVRKSTQIVQLKRCIFQTQSVVQNLL